LPWIECSSSRAPSWCAERTAPGGTYPWPVGHPRCHMRHAAVRPLTQASTTPTAFRCCPASGHTQNLTLAAMYPPDRPVDFRADPLPVYEIPHNLTGNRIPVTKADGGSQYRPRLDVPRQHTSHPNDSRQHIPPG
jgi:hypothetical protein